MPSLLPALCLTSALTLLLASVTGSVTVPWTRWPALLFSTAPLAAQDALLQAVLAVRLPRVLAAFACGGLLAVAGAMMQVLLANPLADPYVLGVSGGAATGALLVLMLGVAALPVSMGALLGAGVALTLVLMRGSRDHQQDTTRLLLGGVVLAAGWSALITLLLALAPESRLRGMVFWLMGDLDGVTAWWLPTTALALVLILLRPLAADLNVLLRGEVLAFSLGVPVARRRLQLVLLAGLATALAVATVGSIGFVGLLVPHAVRLRIGNDQRRLLPASALLGGCLLTLADLAARTCCSPVQLPVGVLTALLGVPCFLWLLRGTRS